MRSALLRSLKGFLTFFAIFIFSAWQLNAQVTCASNETKYVIEIDATSESWLSEVAWALVDASGAVVDSSAPGDITSQAIYRDTVCLTNGASFTFRAYDEYGDGWQGSIYSVYRECDGFVAANNGGTPPSNGVDQGGSRDLEVSESFTANTCPSCPSPSVLTAGNLTSSSANLSWTENGTATVWDIEWGASGFTQGAGTTVSGVSSNPYPLTGLIANTSYNFYVRADCGASGGAGQSSWAGPFTFNTSCLAQTLPYAENFDTDRGCFNIVNGGGGPESWFHSTSLSQNLDGTGYMRVDSDVDGNGILMQETFISPIIDASSISGPLLLEFDHYFRSIGGDLGEVDVYDGTQWVNVYSVSSNTGDWSSPDHQIINISAYANANLQVRFYYDDGNSWAWYWAVDNFSVSVNPCPDPTNITLLSSTSTSAIIGWTDIAGATVWDIEYGASGFTLGTGTMVMGVNGNPTQITGLTSQTSYDFYVRSDCGASGGTGQSNWVGPFTFTTPFGVSCATGSSSSIFNEEFDASGNWTGDVSGGNGNWNFGETGTTSSGSTGPSGAQSGSAYMYFEASSTGFPNVTANAISPAIDLSQGTGAASLVFYVHAYGSTMGTLNVDVSSSGPAGPWYNLYTQTGEVQTDELDPWSMQTAGLDSLLGQQIHIRFNYTSGSNFYSDLAIDNMSIYSCASCPPPSFLTASNITAASADLNWFSGGSPDAEVEFGPTGYAPGSGTKLAINGTSTTLAGLMANTDYDVYVRDSCGTGDVSSWVGPTAFTTLCLPFTAPYSENFDMATTPDLPGCWTKIEGGNAIQTASSTDHGEPPTSSPNVLAINDAPAGTDQILISPQFSDLGTGVNRITVQVSFEGGTTSNPTLDTLYIGVMTDPTDGATFTALEALVFPKVDDLFRKIIVNLDNASLIGSAEYIAFKYANAGGGWEFFLDDFAYEPIPACAEPTPLYATNLTGSTADLSWIANGSFNSFDLEFGLSGFSLGTGTSISALTDTFYNVTGLMQATDYDYYVRANCGSGGFSSFSGPFTFTTGISPAQGITCSAGNATAVFTEEFDAVNGWTGDINGGNDTWEIPGAPTSSNTGPDNEHSGPAGSFMNFEASNTAVSSGAIVSPAIDLSSGREAAELSFWMHAYGADMGTLTVGVGNSPAGPFTPVFSWSGQLQTAGSDPWQNVGVDLTNYIGQIIYLQFHQLDDQGGFTGDMSIDLVEVTTCITCPRPTALNASNITSNSVDLDWTAGGAETQWLVEYGPAGFALGTGSTVLAGSNPYTLTGLFQSTEYDIYLRGICGPGDTSSAEGPVSITTTCGAALSGTYTIDGNLGRTATNFVSFTNAVNVLNNCGISGPVTINVAAGNYNGTVELGPITGASATNTITFDGSDSALVELTHSSTTDEPTLYFNGADHVTIQNMTVSNTSTSDAWGIMFQNSSDSNTINQVHVKMPVGTTTDVIGLVASNSLSFETSAGDNTNYITIQNSLFSGGETGVHLTGGSTSASHNVGNRILNNTFRMQDDHAIEVDGQDSLWVEGNNISDLQNSGADAIYLEDVNDFYVRANTVVSTGWGLYIVDGNDGYTPTNNSEVINNMIVSQSDDAIYLNDAIYINVYHNSTSGLIGLLINDDEQLDIRNNIFTSNGDFAFESTDPIDASTLLNYNLYFRGDAGDLADDGNAAYADLATWQGADATRNMNSVSGDPLFTGANDLHVFGLPANDAGTPIASVTTDIDGEARSATTPDIGADEYDVALNDAVAVRAYIDQNGCNSLTDTVWLEVQNGGINTITALPVTFIVSGDIQDTVTNTVILNLAAFETDTIIAGVFDSRDGGNFDITVYTQLPSDEDNGNDTAKTSGQRFRVVPTITDVSCNGGNDGSVTVVLENAQGLDGSLTTSFATNNGAAGNMFDINVLKANLNIYGFEVNLDPGTHTVDVYYKSGSYIGSESNAGDWTFLESVSLTSAGTDQPTNLTLSSSLLLSSGSYSFFITTPTSNSFNYYNGTAEGALEASNSDLEIFEGIGRGTGGFSGGTNTPRVFSGSIVYQAGEASYVWSNGDTTATADTLTAGTYTLTATDGEGCTNTITVTVGEPMPLAVNKTVSNATCLANTDGFIQVTPSGGTAPYRYIWNNGDTSATAAMSDTTGLGVGQITLQVIDDNNCVLYDTTNIVVEDTVHPVVTLMSHTAYLDASGNVTIDSSDVENGSTDACGIATIALDISSFTCSEVGTNTVTVTVTDVNGNSSQGTTTVTVVDTVSPVASAQPFTAYLDSSGIVSITASDVDNGSSDACGIAFMSVAPSSFGCAEAGPNNVTLTVTDQNGNTSTATAMVTIIDTLDPWIDGTDITVALDSNGQAVVQPTDVAGIGGYSVDQSGTFNPVSMTGATPIPLGDDQVSNPLPLGFNFTFFDSTYTEFRVSSNGFITFSPGTGSGCCSGQNIPNAFNPNNLIAFAWSDIDPGNGGQPSVNLVHYQTMGTAPNRVMVLEFLNVDQFPSGNNITVQVHLFEGSNRIEVHTTAMPSDGGNYTMGVENEDGTKAVAVSGRNSANWSASNDFVAFVPAVGEDNCQTTTVLSPNTFSCNDIGANSATLTITDASGNTGSDVVTITVIDTIAPVVSTQAHTAYLDASGSVTITASDVDNGTADACGIASMTVSPSTFSCSDLGANTVTLTVTDNNGNVDSATALVTVMDTVSPMVMLQNHTAYLDASGNVTIDSSDVDNGSNDACGVEFINLSQVSFNCADVGPNTIAVTVIDSNGNSTTANTTVTVVDTVSPTAIAQDITIYLDGNGQQTILPADIDNGSSDVCGIASLDLDTTNFDCDDIGPNPVVLTAMDVNGNMDTAWATVTVIDTVSPTVTTRNHTAYLDASGNTTIDVLDVSSGSSSACSIDTVIVDRTAFTCVDLGLNTVTVTATASGGTASNSATATVTVVDTISPTVVTQMFTTYVDASGNASIVPTDVEGGSTDNCTVVGYSVDISSFDCTNLGANTVILTVTDQSGNTSSAPATVMVVDTIAPSASARDITVYLNASGSVTIMPSMVNTGSSDNCSSTLSLSKATYGCGDEGLNQEYLIITDADGNMDSTDFLITVLDTISPTMLTKNITVQLGATGAVSIAPSQLDSLSSDNCSNQLFYTASKTNFTCANLGANTVTLTATDVNGNSSSATAVVTVEDNLAPTVNTQSVTLTLDASGNATLMPAMVNNGSTDNCSIASYSLSQMNFTCADLGTNTVALIATDGSGNIASANATITVVDNMAPTAIAQNATVQLDANGNATISAMMINNGSTDNCSVSSMSVSPSSFNCSDVGPNTVTLTVMDASGNTASTTATVTVMDMVAPVVATRNITVSLDASGNASIQAIDVNNGSADACGIASLSVTPSSFTCADLGANTVSLTATDANGNASTGTATVTVTDNRAPTVVTQSFTAVLDANGQATITPADVDNGSSDNCSIASYSLDVSTFTCNALGQNAVNLTVTDQSGNSATGTAIVSVVDNTAPTVSTQNITVQLNASGQVSIQPSQINSGSSDNCNISSYSLDVSTFTCADVGANTVTLTATDASGNSATGTATVTVQDNIAPTAVAQNITVQLNTSGNATISAASVNNGSTDACGISNLSVSPSSFTCADLGSNSVTLTVTDNNGNTSTATATVTVEDNTAPTVVTQNVTVYLNASGTASITAADVNNGSSDNCSVATTSVSQTTFGCADRGQNLVTLTVTDGSGNSASAGASVIVVDTISPSINNLPSNITAYATAQSCAANVSWTNITGSDNCSVASVVTSQANGSSFNLGNTMVSVTVTDGAGNTSSGSFMVTVVDTVAPVFTAVPTNITITPNPNSCDATVTWSAPSASDNCSAATITTSVASGSTFNVGNTTVTYSATDAAGNSRTGSFVVTVTDQVAPTISNTPANIVRGNDAGSCDAVVNYTMPAVGDNCTGATISSSHPSGTTFPVGTTNVTFTATDGAGNTTTSSFTITVEDREAPVATSVPASDTVGQCNATYTYTTPTGTDNCSAVTVRQVAGLPSGAVFPTGPTVNQFELIDASGNRTFVNFTVFIVPQGTPQLPSLLEICANADPVEITQGQNITWSGNGIVNGGTTFDPGRAGAGRHALNYVFTDAQGCQVSGTIQVTVTPQPTKPVVTKIASNTLSTGNYNDYQWYRDGVAIPGARSQTYTYTVGGNYQVMVGNSFACTNYSDGFVVGNSGGGIGLDEEVLAGLEIYPNPSNGVVNIDLKVGTDKELSVTLFSIDGKKVYEQTGLKTNSSGNIRLDFGNLPTATYFLHIRTEDQVAIRKLLMN